MGELGKTELTKKNYETSELKETRGFVWGTGGRFVKHAVQWFGFEWIEKK